MKIVLTIVLICFIPFISSMEVSPTQLDFEGSTGEIICKNVTINVVEANVVVEDRWAVKGYVGRDFLAHKLNAVDLGLTVDYEMGFFAEEKVKKQVCVSGNSAGFYHGLLLYRADGDNSGVGIWAEVDLVGADVITLEGNFVASVENDSGLIVFVLGLLLVLLLVGLVVLLSV